MNKINSKLSNEIRTRYSLDMNYEKTIGKFDLFITCSGFEERTLGLIKKLTPKTKIENFIIFLYHPQEENIYIKNLKNLGYFRSAAKNLNVVNEHVIHIDPTNPWEFKKTLQKIIEENSINKKSNVLIDITSFTRVFLYEIIHSISKSKCNFTVCYTEPEQYTETLPTGINNIIISPSFSGKPRANKKSLLLLFFGWETGRTIGIFENYNSDEQIGVIGTQSIDQKHIEWANMSTKRNEELIDEIKRIETCPTLDLEKILKFIEKIYVKKEKEYAKKKQKFSFAIAGMGPKIQNLASSLFALDKRNIQLVYGTPAYWGSATADSIEKPVESEGIGTTYVYGPFNK